MQVSLSDGSSAQAVALSSNGRTVDCCIVDHNMWMLTEGDRHIAIRKASNGEMITKVDLMTDDGVAIARVGPRVWVATRSGKVFILGNDGVILGVLQPSSIPLVTKFHPIRSSSVVTSGGGKDFHLWDMTQFSVERTFLGLTPGEIVTHVTLAHPLHESGSLIACSSHSIRLWAQDGTLLSEANEGGVCCLSIPADNAPHAATDGVTLWVAQSGWITIFNLASTRKASQFRRDKAIPCARVRHLFSTDSTRVGTFDSEGLVTVWDCATLLPLRSFKVPTSGEFLSNFGELPATLMCIPAVESRSVKLWCVADGSALIWTDEIAKDLLPSGANGEKPSSSAADCVDIEREEIKYLRRKMKYLENMATLFRQKIGILFREKSAAAGGNSPSKYTTPAYIQAFNEVDQAFMRALEKWDEESREQEPLPEAPQGGLQGLAAEQTVQEQQEFVDYWKQKYYHLVDEFSKVRKEHEGFISIMNEQHRQDPDTPTASIDSKRALYITQLIKDKNDLRERSMQLSDDVTKLRGLLKNQALGVSGGENSLDAIDALRKESSELRRELLESRQKYEQCQSAVAEAQQLQKHNLILKQRVKKMRSELDIAQIQLSETSTNMQRDFQSMLDTIARLESRSKFLEDESKFVDVRRAQADLELATLRSSLETQEQLNLSIQKELEQRERIEKSTLEHLQSELTLMCQSLDDRDAKIASLLTQNNSLVSQVKDFEAGAQHLHNTIAIKDTEIFSLSDRLSTVESVLQDRKQYARAVDELQGRMEMVVEELRHGFTPVQFAANITELEGRIANLFALESQLRQKDDIIAMRDDEIAMLKEHAVNVEKQIQQVSTIFSQIPRSIEEVEQLLVEVDEYRRRLGSDAETQEMVQLRLLELAARRRTLDGAPFVFELSSTSQK